MRSEVLCKSLKVRETLFRINRNKVQVVCLKTEFMFPNFFFKGSAGEAPTCYFLYIFVKKNKTVQSTKYKACSRKEKRGQRH